MRTTVVLDDDIYAIVRQRAFDERRSFGAVLSELARTGLSDENDGRRRRPLGLYAGQIWIADDFEETPPEILESLDAPVEPA